LTRAETYRVVFVYHLDSSVFVLNIQPSGTAGPRCPNAWLLSFCAGLWAVLLGTGCGEPERSEPVQSIISGHITVDSRVDSSADFRGFEVLVLRPDGRSLDTLGHAVTGRDGAYRTVVTAPERGVYPLLIRRRGNVLLRTDYVVAHQDTAQLDIAFPFQGNYVPVQSDENYALLTYRNTMQQHRQQLIRRLQQRAAIGGQRAGQSNVSMNVRQTSSILWSMRQNYPGTYATQMASVESLSLLESWNDSLVVTRARQIDPSNPRYVAAARIARRAEARLHGQEKAVALLSSFEERSATDDQRAAIHAEIVRSYIDSLDADRALDAADRLISEHPRSDWAEWADRARYEVENLLPGRTVPSVEMRTVDGDTLVTDALDGNLVVLEFYVPSDEVYQQQIPTRNALYEATRTDSVTFVSISLEPDSLLNRAFFEGRTLPGRHMIAPGGAEGEFARTFNIATVPTRFLLDRDGSIVGKYPGATFFSMGDAVADLLDAPATLPGTMEGTRGAPSLSSPASPPLPAPGK